MPRRRLLALALSLLLLCGADFATADDSEATASPSINPLLPGALGTGLGLVISAASAASEASVASVASASAAESEHPTGTATATAVWATKTAGGMVPYTDVNDTLVLHDDGSVTYSCPNKDDEWTVEQLTDSLSAHTATGPGCTMRYAFKGDGVQIYGATGTEGGVFGCSVSASGRNFTTWLNGHGVSNTFKPYQGSCAMQGLGWDDHMIELVNSPYQPGKVYFTGLRFSTNETESPWETHTWDACCAGYTFPDGVATTVDAASATGGAAAAEGGGAAAGLAGGTTVLVVCGLAGVVILASLLIACMCCSKRPAAGGSGTAALRAALHGSSAGSGSDEESRPLKREKKHTRRRHRAPSTDEESATTSSSTEESSASETDTSGEKGDRRGTARRRRGGR